MPKNVSVSNTDAHIVDPRSMLEIADHAKDLNDRVTAELMVARAYAAYDDMYAAAALPEAPHEEEMADPAAPLPEFGPTPLTIRKFWQ